MHDSNISAEVEKMLFNSGLFFYVVTDNELNIIKANHLYHHTYANAADCYFKAHSIFKEHCNELFASSDSVIAIEHTFLQPVSSEEITCKWEISRCSLNSDSNQLGYSFIGTRLQQPLQLQPDLQKPDERIFDQLLDAVIITDTNSIIKAFNKAAEELYQLKSEDVIGKGSQLLNHETTQTTVEQAVKELFQNNRWSGDIFFTRKTDQQRIHLSSAVSSIFDAQKNKIGYVTVNRELTNFRTNDRQLLTQLQQQSNYFEAFTPGVVIHDGDGKIVYSNSSAEKILGLTKQQMMGKTSIDATWNCVKEDFTAFPENEHPAMVCLQLGEPVQNVLMGVYKFNESISWININANPLLNKDGKTEAVVAIFADVTAERNAYLKLEESEKRIQTALSNVGDNAWEHNLQTNQIWFSHPSNPFIGFTNEEFQAALKSGTNLWWQQTYNEDRKLLEQTDLEYKQGKRNSHTLEYRIFNKDGTMRWVLDRGVVIEKNAEGKPMRIVGTHTDVSREKKLQQELFSQKEKKRKEIVEAVLQAQELEREQIANELHEGIAQVLSSVKLVLEAPAANSSAIEEKFKVANETIGEIIQDLKQISQNINSSSLKLFGLVQAVEDFITNCSINSSIIINAVFDNFSLNKEIHYSQQLALLRVLQEMVKSLMRYTSVTEINIELLADNDIMQLLIKHNGKVLPSKDGYYNVTTKNIINRAEQYNGHVEFITAPENTTIVKVILPVSIQ